ncbi:MAG: hypothetical protein A2096_11175 [Spirochaetes bacterium GWF1_41_5]|nr:MAG: hypothetical protein A2096_11175 [Spirochaetes bacterium GWF1_41_5]HBE01359.1 hypothetical protein [Spirochaetia bacterium]
MAITRDDIARSCAVSSATVSRTYNLPGKVDSVKRKLIFDTARQMGYVPDKNASSLRRKSAGVVLFLEKKSMEKSTERFYYWFYADILKTLLREADSSVLNLQLKSYSGRADLKRILKEGSCDGILCHTMDPPMLDLVRASSIPYVSCYRTEDRFYNTVFVSEYETGRIAAEYFIKKKYSRPFHVTGKLAAIDVCRKRWEGFNSGFDGRAACLDGELGIHGGYESGLRLFTEIRKKNIDCVFVVNDLTAVGFIQALYSKGLSVPGDVDIIACDNLPFTVGLPCAINTIDLRLCEVYARAWRSLIKCIGRQEKIYIPVRPRLITAEIKK